MIFGNKKLIVLVQGSNVQLCYSDFKKVDNRRGLCFRVDILVPHRRETLATEGGGLLLIVTQRGVFV